MAGIPKNELTEKHWQALKLIESGMARKDVAVKIGWGPDYFKKLCSGDPCVGTAADLFKKEVQKIESKRDEDTKALVKVNIQDAQEQVKRVLSEFKSKKRLNYDDKKILVTLTNALNKSTPPVNIKNLSYSYTSGLTPEELIHEFTRLKSIAESSFDRRAVQKPDPRGSGGLPASDEPRDRLAEDS